MVESSEDITAWMPPVPGIREVFHAHFTRHAYPSHTHDSWTLLIVDDGAVAYGLGRHQHGALRSLVTLLPPDVPDYPIGFAYPTKTGARAAVLTAPGVAKAELLEDGVVIGSQPVGATGFASLVVNRPYPALAERSFEVRLYDAAGHQVSALPVPPQV